MAETVCWFAKTDSISRSKTVCHLKQSHYGAKKVEWNLSNHISIIKICIFIFWYYLQWIECTQICNCENTVLLSSICWTNSDFIKDSSINFQCQIKILLLFCQPQENSTPVILQNFYHITCNHNCWKSISWNSSI